MIEQKIDKILEKLEAHSVLLERHSVLHEQNSSDLAEHIRRTDLLEGKIVPLEKQSDAFKTVFKAIAYIATISGTLFGIVKGVGEYLLRRGS